MANDFFRFKQFTVIHKACSMKVGTDGVLLGSWTNVDNVSSILDVGTGSGLIALMLAQRCKAKITGVEIDKDAAVQAGENFLASPWNNRLFAVHNSFQQYATTATEKFDLIVSNPPFFSGSLKSLNVAKRLARHDDSLSIEAIMHGASELLAPNGRLAIITPAKHAVNPDIYATAYKLYPCRTMLIYSKPGQEPVRKMTEYAAKDDKCIHNTLCIYNSDGTYSHQYKELTKDFYLAF